MELKAMSTKPGNDRKLRTGASPDWSEQASSTQEISLAQTKYTQAVRVGFSRNMLLLKLIAS